MLGVKKMNDNDRPISFEKVRGFFRSGELWKKEPDELNRCLRGLAIEAEPNEAIQHHHVIISAAIQNILLHRLLQEQERRNKNITFWFMVLAIVSLISSITQIIVSLMK
jgi:hypothetical protein